MSALAAPIAMHRALPPEEAARGDFYSLLARLLRGAPDMELLASMASAPRLPAEGNGGLAKAWDDLVDASSVMDADAATEEYEALFASVGKSLVSPFLGYYSGAPAADHPRVRIVGDLAKLGLAVRDTVTEPEDHVAGLFDVMRVLVVGGAGRSPGTVDEQRQFFSSHLQPSLTKFFAALQGSTQANFYRKVAAFGAAFAALEQESFQLD